MSTTETEILAWLAAQKPAMIAALREMVDTDGGSYDKPGVDAVGAQVARFMAAQGIPVQTLPQARFGDCLPEAGNEKVAKTTREPFGSLERTQKLLAAHPRLAKIVANVAANAGVQKWLAMRGSNSF